MSSIHVFAYKFSSFFFNNTEGAGKEFMTRKFTFGVLSVYRFSKQNREIINLDILMISEIYNAENIELKILVFMFG